ncbi:hypothetical protein HYC85_002540 [Camellia sinensis]|uniref:Uncharacterized protein n=1 Tax=Camellia sinensis TaxID=4442 RepID=A0A7J7I9S7_CAMSI|nr:hypothetical protein HYC85_002540 [Camellia sinensis]
MAKKEQTFHNLLPSNHHQPLTLSHYPSLHHFFPPTSIPFAPSYPSSPPHPFPATTIVRYFCPITVTLTPTPDGFSISTPHTSTCYNWMWT